MAMAAFGSLRRQKPARKENRVQRLFMAREPACNVSNHSSSTASGSAKRFFRENDASEEEDVFKDEKV